MDTTTDINNDEVMTGYYKLQENRRIYRVRKNANRTEPSFETRKVPVRLNKPETKVPAVYYFVSLFLTKWAGEALKYIVETLLYRERVAALKYEQIKMQNVEILKKNVDLTEKLAESNLINGLMVADLENGIRNLEADVIAKEREK
ncbi:hypothetical protein RhiirC2_795774 [Rhizophagus irregularis]|uniref:Uncharacterized protein n=1 Tax=Rhizophagus irregularis TaxID=588596 RepID=A0A2N1MAV7_9GLOM|nr:hypothetical protein RhiirC2_795774 [Rhizophagus irregularis]